MIIQTIYNIILIKKIKKNEHYKTGHCTWNATVITPGLTLKLSKMSHNFQSV